MRPLIFLTLLLAMPSAASDGESIDTIVNAYYEVISGPAGFVYDAERDRDIHMENAAITKFFADGSRQRHNFETEQSLIISPYETPFFEYEIKRRVEQYGNIAHVWSEFVIKDSPQSEPYDGGYNSISLIYENERWWISSWSTQYKTSIFDNATEHERGLLTDLSANEFRDVVKAIVEDTLQTCEVQGTMEGRAKMNLAVVGEVKAQLVCAVEGNEQGNEKGGEDDGE